jgi:predicted ATPase
MGTHRLKDLTRAEHVFQIKISGLENSFPPLRSLQAVANNLPEQMTELIGRDVELAEIKRLLNDTRLLTVLAPGGTGKTRLAIQAAADLATEYADGVFFIGLADLTTSADILQAVAEEVGVAYSSDEDPQTQLLEYLRPRRQLLVFDNFEHLGDGAQIVSEILRAAPQVKVIATSRSKLNLTGEAVMPLIGLGVDWDTPEAALRTSGVRLFLDAAHRANPGLIIETEDLEPLAEILRLTGGMPLAIILAAAWSDVLSIPDISAEIAKNLDFLETPQGDVPERHQSIRAVFDYSWGLLNSAEKDAFAALSVFRGGFTREAAETVTGASLRDLANLSNKTLLVPSPSSGRYAIHELLRQYAEAELAALPERDRSIRDAHAQYYSDLCARRQHARPAGREVCRRRVPRAPGQRRQPVPPRLRQEALRQPRSSPGPHHREERHRGQSVGCYRGRDARFAPGVCAVQVSDGSGREFQNPQRPLVGFTRTLGQVGGGDTAGLFYLRRMAARYGCSTTSSL